MKIKLLTCVIVVSASIMAGTRPVIAAVVVLNNSFEATPTFSPPGAVAPAGFYYTAPFGGLVTIPNWTFAASSGGLSSGTYDGLVGAGLTSGNTGGLGALSPFPDGTTAAFLEVLGTFSQAISGFNGGETYYVSFYSTARPAPFGPQTVEVKLDATTLTFNAASTVTPTSSAWTHYISDPFTTTAGTHTLSFTGVTGADLTSYIDLVNITGVPEPTTIGLLAVGGLLIVRRRSSSSGGQGWRSRRP